MGDLPSRAFILHDQLYVLSSLLYDDTLVLTATIRYANYQA